MSTFNTLEEACEFFEKDRFATINGMKMTELTDTVCVAEMSITDDHRNAIGGIMGGVIFTLCDFAFAGLINNIHSPSVAIDSNIKFLSASKGVRLTAKAELVRTGRTTTVACVRVTDEFDKKIALFTATGYKC